MTEITTDNPLVKFEFWCKDISWQYWYIWLLLAILLMWCIDKRSKKIKMGGNKVGRPCPSWVHKRPKVRETEHTISSKSILFGVGVIVTGLFLLRKL